MSHPTATCPARVLSRSCSTSIRISTTVLATASAMPKTMPAALSQPKARAMAQPATVATALCATAPGTAIRQTRSSSCGWKCMPTLNISRMTPISAICVARFASATKPGVNGPTTMPASM
jgi:hypothetical protein